LAGPGAGGAERGGAGGRGGVRRRRQVPGPGQVRPARLDGVQGRGDQAPGVNPAGAAVGREGGAVSEPAETAAGAGPKKEVTVDDVMEALKAVVDPELGINVVDLGLVYGVKLEPAGEGELPAATIDMTLTSAACPLTDVIEDQAASALADVLSSVTIN